VPVSAAQPATAIDAVPDEVAVPAGDSLAAEAPAKPLRAQRRRRG
jgi:hypothetical protein